MEYYPVRAVVGNGWEIAVVSATHVIVLVKADGSKFASREEAKAFIDMLTK